MALTRPYINNIPAFDATIQSGTTILLNVLGGDAITGYQFSLYKNDGSSEPFYTSEIISVGGDVESLSIRSFPITILPSMGLENNFSYKIRAKTHNDSGYSIDSQDVIFYCYLTPTIYLSQNGTIVEDGYVFASSNPSVTINFNPNNINSIATPNIGVLTLYGITDAGNKDLLATNSDIYNFLKNSLDNTYSLNLTLTDFTRNVDDSGNLLPSSDRLYNHFEIEYTIETLQGMEVTQNIQNLNCYYVVIRNPQYLQVENKCKEGIIQLTCELTSLSGQTNPDVPVVYIDNKEIDLTQQNAWVQWQGTFTLQMPFTLRIWGRNFNIGTIATLSASDDLTRRIDLGYGVDDDGAFIWLNSYMPSPTGVQMFPYYIESNRISISSITATTKLFIGIQGQNGLFDMDFEILN